MEQIEKELHKICSIKCKAKPYTLESRRGIEYIIYIYQTLVLRKKQDISPHPSLKLHRSRRFRTVRFLECLNLLLLSSVCGCFELEKSGGFM